MPISPEERDIVARTILSEAGGQSDESLAAVAHVVKNRLATGQWGNRPSNVVLARKQFEPWSLPRGAANHPLNHSDATPEYQRASQIVDAVFGGQVPDITNGATHFYDPKVQGALGRKAPSWAKGEPLAAVGSHVYYAPEGRVGAAQQASMAGDDDVLAQYGVGRKGDALRVVAPPLGGDAGSILEGYGVSRKNTAPAPAPPARDISTPGRITSYPGGKVVIEPGDVTTKAEQAAGAARGLPAQFVSGIPIAGPAINLATAGVQAIPPDPRGDVTYLDRFGRVLYQQRRADKAFAEQNPALSTGAQVAGGVAGAGLGAMTAPGRIAMGMQGPSTAARMWGGGIGGGAVNAVDALLRGENPIEAGVIGAAGGFVGPQIGEGAQYLTRGALGARTTAAGPLAGVPAHGLDLLINRGLGDMTPAELQAARAMVGPHGFMGDLTPGMRDITKGVAAVQGPGKDIVERAYEGRFAGSRGRLENVLSQHLGPNSNIVDYEHLLTENRARAADPLYAAWRSTQVQPTSQLRALIPRLEAAGAFNAAEELAAIDGRSINRNFFTPNPATQRSGNVSAYPTTETWDLVKQGLDRRIDAAYAGNDRRLAARLINLRGEMIREIERTPAGLVWRQARQEFADRSSLIDQLHAGRDTFLGGRSGLSVDELREELRGLSGPERAARLVGMRSAIAEDMNATRTGDARVGTKLLAPANQDKIRLMIGQRRGDELIGQLEQERFLRERYPDVVPNRHTGASAVQRGEAANLFRGPEPLPWDVMRPTTYPIVGRLMPQNVINDIRMGGQAQSAPALGRLMITPAQGPQMDDLVRALLRERDRSGRGARAGTAADRGISALIAGPATSTYRRYYENQRPE